MANTRGVLTALVALTLMAGGVVVALPSDAASRSVADYTTAEAGNPIVDGWYADPDTAVYQGVYWIYPTASQGSEQQTYLDAFASTDLVHWTKHPNVLTTANVSWAHRGLRAPAPVERNGRYYLYFAANDLQRDSELGGIGVAVADKPEGPYTDAIGKPLIGAFHNGAQPIDPDVFIDSDGQAYLYYGGRGHANVVKLNADMTSLGTFANGKRYREITPAGYAEGAQVFTRDGRYYLMWSASGPDRAVSYAMADSPTGPFTKPATILWQDPAVARGSGGSGVFTVPGTDTWYLVYHRRQLSEADGNHRELAYDRMTFNTDGTIQPVKMLVKDDFEDGNALGWRIFGGSWSVGGRRLSVESSAGGKAMQNTNFADLVYDADVIVTGGDPAGDAGVVFRATKLGRGADAFAGYYAGIRPSGSVVLGKASYDWTELAATGLTVTTGTTYHLRVKAIGPAIRVYVDDMTTPKISVTDPSFTTGANGVRALFADAAFDNIAIAHP
jgi:hypothetical protein